MIKRLELIGPSCLTNAKDDEPIFVLKSTDELAPRAVRLWAQAYRDQKQSAGEFDERQMAKFTEAMSLADQMETWRTSQSDRTTNSGGGGK